MWRAADAIFSASMARAESDSGRLRAEQAAKGIDLSRYVDPDFHALEQERIFQRTWLAICPEYRLSRPGDFVVFDEVGLSLVLLRDEVGTVRAFRNACRHRATRLLEGSGRCQEVRCPYHGWTYGLDGRLRHIPAQQGFPGLDPTRLILDSLTDAITADRIRDMARLWLNIENYVQVSLVPAARPIGD